MTIEKAEAKILKTISYSRSDKSKVGYNRDFTFSLYDDNRVQLLIYKPNIKEYSVRCIKGVVDIKESKDKKGIEILYKDQKAYELFEFEF